MTEQEVKTLAQLQPPYTVETTILLFEKKWKKKYVIWKDNVLYFFEKRGTKEAAKEMVEITKETTITQEFDQKEKKNVIIINPQHIMLMGDEGIPLIKEAFEESRKQMEEEMKIEEKDQKDQKAIMKWEEVSNKMSAVKTKWKAEDVQKLFTEIGKNVANEYLYKILPIVAKSWTDEEFIDFFYKKVAEEDLEDMGTFLAFKDKENGKMIFLFGRTQKGGERIASIYKKIYKNYNLVWSEIARCLLASLAYWEIRSSDKMFKWITYSMFEVFDHAEIVTFLHFYADYEEEMNICVWTTLPDHVKSIFTEFVLLFFSLKILIL